MTVVPGAANQERPGLAIHCASRICPRLSLCSPALLSAGRRECAAAAHRRLRLRRKRSAHGRGPRRHRVAGVFPRADVYPVLGGCDPIILVNGIAAAIPWAVMVGAMLAMVSVAMVAHASCPGSLDRIACAAFRSLSVRHHPGHIILDDVRDRAEEGHLDVLWIPLRARVLNHRSARRGTGARTRCRVRPRG